MRFIRNAHIDDNSVRQILAADMECPLIGSSEIHHTYVIGATNPVGIPYHVGVYTVDGLSEYKKDHLTIGQCDKCGGYCKAGVSAEGKVVKCNGEYDDD